MDPPPIAKSEAARARLRRAWAGPILAGRSPLAKSTRSNNPRLLKKLLVNLVSKSYSHACSFHCIWTKK